MLSQRDLDRLKARTKALRHAEAAAQLSVVVWHEGDEPPEPKPFQVRIMVESRDRGP